MSLYDSVQEQRRPLFRQMATESDRGCAIVGCSLLEEDLEFILRARIPSTANPKHIDSLFRGYAPLASFAGKIALCHAFGFIDEQMFKDLEIIRKIRNRFAHEYGNREFFDDATFKQLCGIGCTYPIGTPDYAGATLDELRQEVLEFSPSDRQQPEAIPMSGAKAKFLFTVLLMSQRLTLLREHTDEA
jgi:DNA-binding MltR family transcriptional regulator